MNVDFTQARSQTPPQICQKVHFLPQSGLTLGFFVGGAVRSKRSTFWCSVPPPPPRKKTSIVCYGPGLNSFSHLGVSIFIFNHSSLLDHYFKHYQTYRCTGRLLEQSVRDSQYLRQSVITYVPVYDQCLRCGNKKSTL